MFTPSAEELHNRVKGLQSRLNESSIDAALILQIVDLYYYAGTIGPGCMFVPAQGEPVFLSRQRGQLPAKLPWQTAKYQRWSEFESILRDFGYRVTGCMGLEMDVVPAEIYLRLAKQWPETDFVDIGNQIRRQRAVKSAWEIEVMRETGRRDLEIWRKVPEFISQARTDIDVAALLEAEARRQGHLGGLRMRGFSMELPLSCVLTGENAAVLSAYDVPTSGAGFSSAFPVGASGSPLETGKPILIDYSSSFFGYTLDVTRMFALGKPNKKALDAYQAAVTIQMELMESARPGVCCGDLYESAKAIAQRAGLLEGFMGADGGVPFVGHGIGLEVDELPVLARGSRQVLEEGMILAIEPKFILPGIGAVGLENDFLVTNGGLEKLSLASEEFIFC